MENQTKFYCFPQNNSGGYFVIDESAGICEMVIIEAIDAEDAWRRLNEIGQCVSGMHSSCPCCGDRWYPRCADDGEHEPMIFGTPAAEAEAAFFTKRVFVHHLDGTKSEIKLK